MDAAKQAELKRTLETELERLESELDGFGGNGHDSQTEASGENNYRDHMADQGTATFERELDMTLEGDVRDRIEQVRRALARIESGDYGTCQRCGEPIDPSRLEAMPDADLCIVCKEWEEGR